MRTFDFRPLLEFLPVAAYTCDPEGVLTACNLHAVRLWGRAPQPLDPAERYCGPATLLALDGSPLARERCATACTLQDGCERLGCEVLLERADGGRSNVLEHVGPLLDDGGALAGAIDVLIELPMRARAAYPVRVAASAPTPRSQRVVIADDDRDAADALALMLQALGYDTRVAYDGRAAVEIAESFRPQFALLDLAMPKLDGWQTCRTLRERRDGAAMVIAALTARGGEDTRRRSFAAGFDAHLVKPVDPVAVVHLLQSFAATQPAPR